MTTPHVRALGIAVLCVCCCVQTTAGADDIWDLPPLTADPEAILELAASVPVDDEYVTVPGLHIHTFSIDLPIE